MGEWMYTATFSLPRHYLELSGQLRAPAALTPWKEWAPDPVWTKWRGENFLSYWDSNCDPSVVQPVASRYTYCAIPCSVREIIVVRSKEMKRRCDWAEFSKEGYGSKRAVLPKVMLTYIYHCISKS
jgi:hypothetical protein